MDLQAQTRSFLERVENLFARQERIKKLLKQPEIYGRIDSQHIQKFNELMDSTTETVSMIQNWFSDINLNEATLADALTTLCEVPLADIEEFLNLHKEKEQVTEEDFRRVFFDANESSWPLMNWVDHVFRNQDFTQSVIRDFPLPIDEAFFLDSIINKYIKFMLKSETEFSKKIQSKISEMIDILGTRSRISRLMVLITTGIQKDPGWKTNIKMGAHFFYGFI